MADTSPIPGIPAARASLSHIEEALAETGPGLAELMARAMRELADFRDALILARRQGRDGLDDLLDRTNSLLSLTISSAYPIVGVRRQRIENTRDGLRDLLADIDRQG